MLNEILTNGWSELIMDDVVGPSCSYIGKSIPGFWGVVQFFSLLGSKDHISFSDVR